jgi:hypothetical protein
MTERQQLEQLLAAGNGGTVTLPRKRAQELAQKLRARGGGEGLTRLERLLGSPGDVEVDRAEAQTLLEELRASGRRWVFGSQEPPVAPTEAPPPEPPPPEARAPEPPPAPTPEPAVEPEPVPKSAAEPEPSPAPEPPPPPRRGFWSRLFGRAAE